MKEQTTLLIVPAMSDMAGQCRIVVRSGKVSNALDDYRGNPDNWKDAGLMSSQGKLVCLDATLAVWDELKSCEPLMAGTQFVFESNEAPAS